DGKLREPLGETGGKGGIFDVPTANTSPCVVNQSAFFFEDFSNSSVNPWSSTCTSMPPRRRLPGFRPSSDTSAAHTKTPEFPPDSRCRHWADSSKFSKGFVVRVTPTGRPVQWTRSPSHFQVVGSQFTFVKSDSPSDRQPGPFPSRNAFGDSEGS